MSDITERVRDYLGNGGLFNPEHMNHDAVRDLVMDMDAKVRELEARLEWREDGHDGIYCRDETIKLLEAEVARQREKVDSTDIKLAIALDRAEAAEAKLKRVEALTLLEEYVDPSQIAAALQEGK